MTLADADAAEKRSDFLQASRLHESRAMIRRLVVLLFSTWGAVASADSTTTTTMVGSCTGSDGVTANFAVGPSGVQALAPAQLFGDAECQCDTDDILIQIQVTATSIAVGATPNIQLWVGQGCDNYSTRTTTTNNTCEQLTSPDIADFRTGSPVTGFFNIPIPARALFQPSFNHTHDISQCTDPSITTASNNLYIFIGANLQSPSTTCTISLQEGFAPPAGPVSPSVAPGDSAVQVNWDPPPTTSNAPQPSFYQVLCADSCGQPIKKSANTPYYSVCVDGNIERRYIVPATTSVSTTDDGGTTVVGDMSVITSLPLGPEDVPNDGGTDGSVGDGGVVCTAFTDPMTALKTLDQKYVCDDFVAPAGQTNFGRRITGLNNDETYYFTVLSIDAFGNPTPSEIFQGVPKPAENLYRRYVNSGGRASGFCFIATAAYGSYEHPYVHILREFRDRSLLSSSLGRSFVEFYYAHSPPAAQFIADHPVAKRLTQVALLPAIGFSAFWLYLAAWEKALLGALLLSLLLYRKIFHRKILRRGHA